MPNNRKSGSVVKPVNTSSYGTSSNVQSEESVKTPDKFLCISFCLSACRSSCRSECASACASNCGKACASACKAACKAECRSMCYGAGSSTDTELADQVKSVEDIIL